MSNGGLFELIEPLDRIGREAAGRSEVRGPRARWSAFSEISQLLTSTRLEFDDVLRAILDLVIRYTGAERGFLILRHEKEELSVQIARNAREERLEPGEIAYSGSIVRRALEERRPVLVADQSTATSISDSAGRLGLRSAMCVPLMTHPPRAGAAPAIAAERRRLAFSDEPEVLGVIYVDSAASETAHDPDDLEFFVALANQATSTILNARLYQQATTEPLSRLYTRWHFERLLGESARRAETRRLPYAILLIDIDDFKNVNDRSGHAAGDQVIREIGDVLRASTRAVDTCFRYGGEEFAVLLPDTDDAGAMFAAEKVRAAIAARPFAGVARPVTVSIGVAVAPPAAHEPQDVVKHADQALYAAKESGKDRVARWSEAIGAAAKRKDRLAGIVTGDFAADHRNVSVLIDAIAAISATGDLADLLTLAMDKVMKARNQREAEGKP